MHVSFNLILVPFPQLNESNAIAKTPVSMLIRITIDPWDLDLGKKKPKYFKKVFIVMDWLKHNSLKHW